MIIKCRVCNKEFNPHGNLGRKTCSKKCGDVWKPKGQKVDIKCEECGKIFQSTRKRRTCSKKCSKTWKKSKISFTLNNGKRCGKCSKLKPLSEFYSYKGKTRAYCKECDKAITYNNQTNNKREYVRLKGGKCQKCGYDKCLGAFDFHHINSDDKLFNIAKRFSPEKMKEELDKCILLCANCHREEHTDIQNWK